MPKLSCYSSGVQKLVRRLNRLHKRFTWKEITWDYPSCVKPGTLSRIAKGGYIPKDEKILFALGLKHVRKSRELKPIEKAIRRMAEDTKAALEHATTRRMR